MSRNGGKRHIWWCVVCGSDEEDELKYGQLCKTKDFNVHFFCLLLSSTFEQRGRDTEGVYGFRVKDIERGLELIKDTVCWYCGHGNASIYCAKPGCRRVFHLTCGQESGCLSQFLGSFESFCHRHNSEYKYRDFKDDTCVICRDGLKFTCDAVQNDCCNSVFHRRCLGSLALSAGYFFKCPLCNNTDQFRKCMRQKGIYVPDRDASWELENNAFNELHAPNYSCEAAVCHSKQGRKFNSVHGFAFMSCSSCGAGSIHRKCCTTADFVCEICTSLFTTNNPDASQDENTLTNSVLQNMITAAEAVPAPERNNRQASRDSPMRRSARQSIQRYADSPDKGTSPFKLRNRREGVGGPPKRRRLC